MRNTTSVYTCRYHADHSDSLTTLPLTIKPIGLHDESEVCVSSLPILDNGPSRNQQHPATTAYLDLPTAKVGLMSTEDGWMLAPLLRCSLRADGGVGYTGGRDSFGEDDVVWHFDLLAISPEVV